jgi:hypothetical protein
MGGVRDERFERLPDPDDDDDAAGGAGADAAPAGPAPHLVLRGLVGMGRLTIR